MNNSPAELVRAALAAAGVFVRPGAVGVPVPPVWPAYVGNLPDTPDNAACVYDTSGVVEGRIQKTGETIIKPGWQLRVRGLDHPTAYAKISDARAALDGVRNLPVAIGADGYTINAVTQAGGILAMGQEPEGKRRNEFTLNGTVTYREEPK